MLCEVLPRALLAELGLARILLGSSGGGQFLVVLPGEARESAEGFLNAAARQISDLSGGIVRLGRDGALPRQRRLTVRDGPDHAAQRRRVHGLNGRRPVTW